MRRCWAILAMIPLVALVATAQQEQGLQWKMKADLEKMVSEARMVALDGGAMGSTVKGAPYSAVEVAESTQVLADGTRIHNEQQTKVFRDSEGRVRRESPDQVTIWDPVANTSYFLDPKTQSARKAMMKTVFIAQGKAIGGSAVGPMAGSVVGSTAGSTQTFEMRVRDGITTATANGEPVDPAELKRMAEVKLGADMPGTIAHVGPGENFRYMVMKRGAPAQTESLGTRIIEGVNCDGTKSVTKIETGAIGNDRPIEITSERWYSPDLQTLMMNRRNDPRTGEEVFRMTNVIRGEQPADLFQVPAGYQLQDRK